MEILLNDIEFLISNISEYISNQDAGKYDYVLERYDSIFKKANKLGIEFQQSKINLPDITKDAFDIILSELRRLKNIIECNNINNNTERDLNKYIKINKGIESPFGKIDINISEKIGQGGNGIVYLGKINNIEIAVKFLIGYNSRKLTRFKAEYFNLCVVRDNLKNVVNNLYYGELKVGANIFPYIIMKRYMCSLKQERLNKQQILFKDIKILFEFLIQTLNSIHNREIIHRDIKPENILVDKEGNYFLADFGIAHFTEGIYPIANKTKENERLANFEFSAPEQINSKFKCVPATDIYSMAQVLYWFVFNHVHKGTGIKNLSNVFKEKEAVIYDRIIKKCLQNEISDRYQSIDYVQEDKEKMSNELYKEYDVFNDMIKFSEILCSTNPDFFNGVSYIEEKKEIQTFIEKLNSKKFEKEIEYNTGKTNNTFKNFYSIENGNFILDYKEINIKRIWGSASSNVYDDLCILELEKVKPYIIDGIECFAVAVVEGENIIPIEKIESGYIKFKGKILRRNELRVEERFIINDYKYMAIGTFKQCSIIKKNDIYFERLQNVKELDKEIIRELKRNISKNKSSEVSMRL